MNEQPPKETQDKEEPESLKKTTRISLEEALTSDAASTAAVADAKKLTTGPIMGIPTHTTPIPQTIKLKRPSTSPIVISQHDMAAAPTAAKIPSTKIPAVPLGEAPTVVKKLVTPIPVSETSRIILEIDAQTAGMRQKTSPIPFLAPSEPTPAPKTIRLKRPSGIVPLPTQPAEQPLTEISDVQTVKKSETAKIEIPKSAESPASITQRKTIKIKRTDRNVIPRTVVLSRPSVAAKPAAGIPKKVEVVAPPPPALEEEPLPVFSIVAGVAAVCLILLVYLLASQAFGPKLLLPIPGALF
jgi:hypothetical protein